MRATTLLLCAFGLVAACEEDPTTIAITVHQVDPSIPIIEIEMRDVLRDGTFPSATTWHPDPIEFPSRHSMAFLGDQIEFYTPFRACAIGRSELSRDGGEDVVAGISNAVTPVLGRVVEVALTMTPLEGEPLPADCELSPIALASPF